MLEQAYTMYASQSKEMTNIFFAIMTTRRTLIERVRRDWKFRGGNDGHIRFPRGRENDEQEGVAASSSSGAFADACRRLGSLLVDDTSYRVVISFFRVPSTQHHGTRTLLEQQHL
jgi:hypothetical protein